ncbi:MAG: hypothetical protein AAFV69_01570 [Pseudomonadota bacterium]
MVLRVIQSWLTTAGVSGWRSGKITLQTTAVAAGCSIAAWFASVAFGYSSATVPLPSRAPSLNELGLAYKSGSKLPPKPFRLLNPGGGDRILTAQTHRWAIKPAVEHNEWDTDDSPYVPTIPHDRPTYRIGCGASCRTKSATRVIRFPLTKNPVVRQVTKSPVGHQTIDLPSRVTENLSTRASWLSRR